MEFKILSPQDENLVQDIREEAETIGYYAMFEYENGFRKTLYWSKKKMQAHADKYSSAYSLKIAGDIAQGKIPEKDMWKYSSFWYKDFDAMAMKTMLRQLISKWGIMSIDMQNAFDKDMAVIHEDGTAEYVDNSEKACELRVNTLTALVDYIKGKPEELRDSMILHVLSPTRVQLITGLIDERKRETLMETNAIVNEFSFDHYYDQERFLIELQANFIETEDLKKIKMVAGNIQQGTTANYDDDGVSQKTTIKSGIANNTDVIVPNPVTLRPYRTFAEIEQPESEYVFRIKDSDRGPAFKLVEADGGLWKKEAMNRIKHYLEYELSVEIEKHNITIIA